MTKRDRFKEPRPEYEPIVEAAHKLYEPGVPFEIPIPEESVFSLLEEAGRRYPNVIAIDYFGQTYTYAQILDQAERAAQVLVDLGVERGDVVALALPNCPQAFVAFYACQRSAQPPGHPTRDCRSVTPPRRESRGRLGGCCQHVFRRW